MYKIVGGDQKEYGPVTAEEMRQWILEGRLSTESLVLVEGQREWQRLEALPEFADALRAQPRASSAGAGAASFAGVPGNWPAEILARRPEVRVGRCLSRAWALQGEHFGLLFSACSVVWLLSTLCQMTPWVGMLINLVMEGALYGGLYLVLLNCIRGRPTRTPEVFAGFGPSFVQLMLVGMITGLLTDIGLLCCLLPGLYLWVAWTFSVPLVADKRLEFWAAMELSRRTITRVWFEMFALLVISFLPMILVFVFVELKVAVLMFPAMQHAMVGGPLDFGGMMRTMSEMTTQLAKTNPLLLMLPRLTLLLNLPFAIAASMYAYEDLFGSRPASAP